MPEREKIIKEFEEICGYTMRPHEFRLFNDVLALLKEQEPKRGKWVKQLPSCPSAIAVGGSRTSVCTICGGWGRKTFKYCPHCGAKMEKQEVKADA